MPDPSSWLSVGQTSNTRFYVVEPGVLAAFMEPGASDTLETARENIDFYLAHFRENGPGVLIYVLGRMVDQTPKARRLYSDTEDPELTLGVSLVVESMLSRAIASFFLGLSRPKTVPLRMMESMEAALDWARQLLDPS